MTLSPAEYKATQDRVELLSRLIIETDQEQLDALIDQAETANAIAPVIDPTAWIRGHDQLRMVTEHARAIRKARREIVRAAESAGSPLPAGVR